MSGEAWLKAQLAAELYRCLVLAPCSCTTRWHEAQRKIVQHCSRCKALSAWEVANELPKTEKLIDSCPLLCSLTST